LGTGIVNTEPQYVVDITATTHDIAPALQQARVLTAMKRFWRESSRAVEILTETEFFARNYKVDSGVSVAQKRLSRLGYSEIR
jgi:hypothetical protein